jgi:hypothetical protein
MKKEQKNKARGNNKESKAKKNQITRNSHLGSSNAFEETENPLSRDRDDISDEKLDELMEKNKDSNFGNPQGLNCRYKYPGNYQFIDMDRNLFGII